MYRYSCNTKISYRSARVQALACMTTAVSLAWSAGSNGTQGSPSIQSTRLDKMTSGLVLLARTPEANVRSAWPLRRGR